MNPERRPKLRRTNQNPCLCRTRLRNRTALLTLCGAAQQGGKHLRVET